MKKWVSCLLVILCTSQFVSCSSNNVSNNIKSSNTAKSESLKADTTKKKQSVPTTIGKEAQPISNDQKLQLYKSIEPKLYEFAKTNIDSLNMKDVDGKVRKTVEYSTKFDGIFGSNGNVNEIRYYNKYRDKLDVGKPYFYSVRPKSEGDTNDAILIELWLSGHQQDYKTARVKIKGTLFEKLLDTLVPGKINYDMVEKVVYKGLYETGKNRAAVYCGSYRIVFSEDIHGANGCCCEITVK